MKFDAVFEGGGVKGLALAGALAEMEDAGYEVENAVGTSAGAILAALTVAGYQAEDIRRIIADTPFGRFKDKSVIDCLPVIGPLASILFSKGLYEGDFFYGWMKDLLEHAPDGPVRTFGDLKKDDPVNPKAHYRLQVVATDITRRQMLILPGAISGYGDKNPDDLEIALAVRMSMSIPYFFEPVELEGSLICDGGVLSNFPVGILDTPRWRKPRWPTFGFLLCSAKDSRPNRICGPLTYFIALFQTMLDARDELDRMKAADFVRTIPIWAEGVSATDFSLTQAQREALYQAGRRAVGEFLRCWDWQEYVRDWRQ